MSDEQQADIETETVKRGRPKGSRTKRRGVKREPLHAGPHHDDGYGDRLENFEFTPYEAANPLAIDSDVLRTSATSMASC